MSKLFKLREWLTVPETAKHLSGLLEEDVTEADVLRLVLDRRLKLSINFVNAAAARKCTVISWEETDWKLVQIPSWIPGFNQKKTSLESVALPQKLQALYNKIPIDEREQYMPLLQGLNIDDKRYLNIDEGIGTITGTWDLSMIGNESLDVEQRYQMLTGGPEVTGNYLEGSFVEGDVDSIFQLQDDMADSSQEEIKKRALELSYKDHKRYFPAHGLPYDAVWVVRTAALREFEQSLNSHSTNVVKLSDNTLLATIAALLASWPSGKQPSAKDLEKAANSVGAKVSDDSIRKALNAAKEIAPSLKSA